MNPLNRYHVNIHVPEWGKNSTLEFIQNVPRKITYSLHVRKKLKGYKKRFRKKIVQFLSKINITERDLDCAFEFYAVDSKIKRMCFRYSLDKNYDIIIVLASTGKLITFFLNSIDDDHPTLDFKKYRRSHV